MSSTDTTLQNPPKPKIRQHRIILVAGMIVTTVTLLVGVTVFVVMQRHAQALLSKSLQLSLQNRVQLIRAEIEAGIDQTVFIATHPLLFDQLQRLNEDANDNAARSALQKSVQSLLSKKLTAIALRDKNGRELTHAGNFARNAALTVPLNLPGRVHLIWDQQLLLHTVIDLKQGADVVGQVAVETALPVAMGAFKDAGLLGDTSELVLCSPFGLDVQCFPTKHRPEVFTLPKRSAQGVPLPIAQALEGATGFVTAYDYRNQEVAAAYAPVGDVGLGMVLKMDRAELYAPVWIQLRYLIPVLAGVLVIALLSLRWLLTLLVRRLLRSEGEAQAMSANLLNSERHERTLLHNLDEGVVSISDKGLIELFNPSAERMFGYRSEEVVGKNVSMLMAERYQGEHDGQMDHYFQTGQTKAIGRNREVAGRRNDGSPFSLDMRISEFFRDGRRQFIGIMRDITERQRFTEALRASELQLRQITDTVPALIAYLDTEQRFRFHNKAYEEVLGLSFEQINGQTLAEVLGQAAYGGIKTKVDDVLQGYPIRYERMQMTAQGDIKNYAMQYFPNFGKGADEGQVIGFYSLGTDITELKRIDRMKTEFISTVSHELRTPLTSIRGSLGLIASGVAGELPETVKTLVGIANNNCERLIRLINNILDSEKIESGNMRLDLQVVSIRQVVQHTLAAITGFADQHSVKVKLQMPEELSLKVRVDSDLMAQVLTNLLSNAVKFSPTDGVVEVKVWCVDKKVRVEVADHGPGISEEFRGRIFQKFSQADSSDTRQKGGTGLGLNISKALIEKMGGQIGFSSKLGAGTTFFVELPEWQDPVPVIQAVRVPHVSLRPRILVFEGDAGVASLISMMLGKAGFEVDIANHATQARTCLESNSYHAVTMDLKLSGQSGVAFISELRGNEKTRDLPVVVISAMAEEGRLQLNRKPLMVSGWLEKPIVEKLLIVSLRRAIAGLECGKPHILHVEDDPDIQRVVAAMAQDFAIFKFAATLDEARDRLREHHFDLVLLDLTLGEDSGWDLVEDIDLLDPRPPVIVFSAHDVYPAGGKQPEAVLVKARTSNTELLNTIRRVLQIAGDPGPSRPQSLS